MCDACCKEVKGWCKSFTRIEKCLVALEAVLLVVFIGFVAFLIFHLLVCSPEQDSELHYLTTPEPSTLGLDEKEFSETTTTTKTTATTTVTKGTLGPDIECTWTPSHKTEATHYYWFPGQNIEQKTTSITSAPNIITEADSNSIFKENDNGYDTVDAYKDCVAALVKFKPPEDVTFGCILTKVTPHWTLTAASCIESIEEVDSLDSFFITDSYGEAQQGQSYAVGDVQIHPQYQGANRSYDLAALRSEEPLVPSEQVLLSIPTMLEYFLVALGERFTILGYGGYRTVVRSPTGRQLSAVATYTVSLAQCAAAREDEQWAPRHLSRGSALTAAACGAGGQCGAHALCAGALGARAAPCSYCSGTPLLRYGKLYAIMAENPQCGVACEPTLFVNVAYLRDWVDSITSK